MCNVDAVDVAVVLDHRLHAGLPEDALPAATGLRAEEVGVLKLDEEACALAEVATDGVVDDFEGGGAACPQGCRIRS